MDCPDQTELNRVTPDWIRFYRIKTRLTPAGTGFRGRPGQTATGTTNRTIRVLLLCVTHCVYGPIRSGQVGPGPIISPPPFRALKGARGASIESGETKEADWSTNSKTPPTHHRRRPPSILLVAYIIRINRASPSPIGHRSLRQ